MINFKSMAVSFSSVALVALVSFLPEAQSAATSPYVISDDRVRSMDITPVLGRGYSIMTNSYHSTCLMVDETTVPSFNYDYVFHDFTNSAPEDLQTDAAGSFSYSFGYWWFKEKIMKDQTMAAAAGTSTSRYIASSMRIERYYSSVREEVSALGADAATLLNRNDYIGFFKACGPTYIRGIRRAQEVTAFFIFTSTSTESAGQLGAKAQTGLWWQRRTETKTVEENSLRIVIKGYGLGLSQDGSEALVAKTLEEYNKVMKFAFRTMTTVPDAHHIGMVYGMEVVPWVHNSNFQVQANVVDEPIEIPLARSLIPQSYRINDPTDKVFDNSSAVSRAAFKCKNPAFQIDRYGFCCEAASLFNQINSEYNDENPNERICRPLRQLNPSLVKDNMASNGEFVARLDSAVRMKVNQLSLLQRCISAAKAIPERYDYYVLKTQDNVKYDSNLELKFSVFELKLALDPFDDYAMVKHMAKELDEFLDMYIQPCYAALSGVNFGNSPGTDPSFLMAYPWHSHRECTKLSCLGRSMRWDRNSPSGGCVPSMISGANSTGFETNLVEEKCNLDVKGSTLECKHSKEELIAHHQKTVNVWETALPRGRIDYFMDNFCLPSITGEQLDADTRDLLIEKHMLATGDVEGLRSFSRNVAYKRPTQQSSIWNNYAQYPLTPLIKAGNGNDGEKGNVWGRDNVAATNRDQNPFWSVSLAKPEQIKEVIVYPVTHSPYIQDFTIELYLAGEKRWEKLHSGVTTGAEIVIDVSSDRNAPALIDQVKIVRRGQNNFLIFAEIEVMNMFSSS